MWFYMYSKPRTVVVVEYAETDEGNGMCTSRWKRPLFYKLELGLGITVT